MKTFLFEILLLIVTNCAFAQYNDFVINYPRSSHGQGAQTWSIAQTNKGFTYFSNQNGLMQYSRAGWDTFKFKNEVRSVMVSKKSSRLYTGGINEFGYYIPSENGKLKYYSISDSIPESERYKIGNVWNIYEIDNSLYFIGDGYIVKYTNGEIGSIYLPSKYLGSCVSGGILYIATTTGFFYVHGDKLRACQNTEILNDKSVRGIIPCDDGLIAITMQQGAFFYDGVNCKKYENQANDFMRDNIVFCAADNNDMFAVGTIKGGVAVIDKKSGKATFYNDYNGLQNNTVLSLSYEYGKNLWVGLDNGIDKIMLTYPIKKLWSQHEFYGAGYDAITSGDTLYLATNRGLFYTSWPKPGKTTEIKEGVGQVWGLCKIDGNLFCMHDRGLFLISNGKLKNISWIPGFWEMTQISGTHDILAGTYGNLWILKPKPGNEFEIRELKGLIGSFNNLISTTGNIVWLNLRNRPIVYKAMLENDSLRVIKEYSLKEGLPDDSYLKINQINNQITVISEMGKYFYDSESDCFKPDENSHSDGTFYNGLAMTTAGNKTVYLQKNGVIVTENGKSKNVRFEEAIIDLQESVTEIVPISDSICIIPNLNGFAFINLNFTEDTATAKNHIINKVFLIDNKGDSLLFAANFCGTKCKPEINYNNSGIRIEYGNKFHSFNYRYKVNKNGYWSHPSKSTSREFTNLTEGEYTFFVEELAGEKVINSDSFTFIVLPPWYRTIWAYIVYIILITLMVLIIKKVEIKKINKEKKKVEDAKNMDILRREQEHELENARNTQQIMLLEKEKLKNELTHKTQELANMMASVAGKNEILNELKKDVTDITTSESTMTASMKKRLAAINSKIDCNIMTDNIFDRFEEQFNLLHNNFIKELKNRYPDLSRNELMLCAYTIMELSTKEIAQLLNISGRGVETMRYRLKKKIVDDKNTDFTEFLKSIINRNDELMPTEATIKMSK